MSGDSSVLAWGTEVSCAADALIDVVMCEAPVDSSDDTSVGASVGVVLMGVVTAAVSDHELLSGPALEPGNTAPDLNRSSNIAYKYKYPLSSESPALILEPPPTKNLVNVGSSIFPSLDKVKLIRLLFVLAREVSSAADATIQGLLLLLLLPLLLLDRENLRAAAGVAGVRGVTAVDSALLLSIISYPSTPKIMSPNAGNTSSCDI